jgi:bifunctional non-homologous end joining protein LigD
MPKSTRRPDRILFPESGFTLEAAVDYYRRAAKWLLPHLKNVPVSFKRYPDTVRGESFWEKDAPSFTPAWVRTFAVPRRSGESSIRYVVINNARTLQWIVESGGIELHPFLHRTTHPERATSVVFDLDPGQGADLADCCRVAVLLREALLRVGLESYAKVSGSKGLQVYVPLNGTLTHDVTQPFSRLVAEELARQHPKLVTARMARQLRARKVFIDWSQNADYKTTVAVYSLRAKSDRPYVSMPLTWDEVEEADTPALFFDPEAALERLTNRGDLFTPVLRKKQTLAGLEGVGGTPSAAMAPDEEAAEAVVAGIRLPKRRSQSGRRLFLVVKMDGKDELWLDMHGKFRRWILTPDRLGTKDLIATPAQEFPIADEYFRGVVPKEWRKRVSIEDAGSYELIDGSYARKRFDLWFTGRALTGEWTLTKTTGEEHRSWVLAPR